MKHFKIAIITILALIFISSTCGDDKENSNTLHTDTLPPAETSKPNTEYNPAFEGQTRIDGAITETPYVAKIIADNLNKPWGIATLPDGRLIITEKRGALIIANTDGTISDPIYGFPEVDDRGQGGLLDIIASPDFNDTRMLYFTLAELTEQGSLTAVGKGRLADDETSIENFNIIFRAIPYFDNSMHFGSRIVFNKEGNIFVSTGERSDLATRPKAQFLDNGYGKVIHITKEGNPVSNNPFINTPDALPEIFSYGHRNPQGLAMHPLTDELWMSEMGPRGGDEINLIKSGINYGWPTITYGIEYNGNPVGNGITEHEGMEQPVYYWDPVQSPSGITFYASDIIPEWQNNLFVGGLSSKHIARLVIVDNKIVGEERLLSNENQRFRDITDHQDGCLYTITDEGRLYRIGK